MCASSYDAGAIMSKSFLDDIISYSLYSDRKNYSGVIW